MIDRYSWIKSWYLNKFVNQAIVLQNRQNVNKASCLDLLYCVHEIIQVGYIFRNITHLYISDSWIIKITVFFRHLQNA
jgi:hypothetical protein